MSVTPREYMAEEAAARPRPSGRRSLLALSPILVFLVIYLVTSLIAHDFYKVPVSAAFLLSSVYALLIIRGRSLEERISIFSEAFCAVAAKPCCHSCSCRAAPKGIIRSVYLQFFRMIKDKCDGSSEILTGSLRTRTVDQSKGVVAHL